MWDGIWTLSAIAKLSLIFLIPNNKRKVNKMSQFHVSDDDFTKSSWSKNNPKTCVMVAKVPEGVAVRDSKDENKTTLRFTHEEWEAFKKGVVGGEF